ncbi:MAG: hypothetical protein RBU23_12995 [Candidatus Auribacterota bacterium]|jgi:hypothetical protein|nr:hypothetical protein [Candidatus Auribacterota bacterium]
MSDYDIVVTPEIESEYSIQVEQVDDNLFSMEIIEVGVLFNEITGLQIVEKLESLDGDDKLSMAAVSGLPGSIESIELSIAENQSEIAGQKEVWEASEASKFITGDKSKLDNVKVQRHDEFVIDAAILANKYVTLTHEVTDNQSIRVFVDDYGIKAQPGVDYSVSGNEVYWGGYVFDGMLEEGEILNVYYY